MTQDHIKHRRGVYASPRQPQGDFGRGSDHAQLGSSDEVNRELNQRGAYRDAEPEQDPATSPRPRTPGQPSSTDPQRVKERPQRAEPLQPDRPGRGDKPLEDGEDPAQRQDAQARKLAKQSEDALDNVRNGYGR